jgi:hypothetical protein
LSVGPPQQSRQRSNDEIRALLLDEPPDVRNDRSLRIEGES